MPRSKGVVIEEWTATPSADSDHYLICFSVVGQSLAEDTVVTRKQTPRFHWHKADWKLFRSIIDHGAQNFPWKGHAAQMEKALSALIRKATRRAVPYGSPAIQRRWTPELEAATQLCEELLASGLDVEARSAINARRRMLDDFARDEWTKVCQSLTATDR